MKNRNRCKRNFIFPLFCLSIGYGANGPVFNYDHQNEILDTTLFCQDWAQQQLGPYLVENNVWGQGNITNYTQCIYVTADSSFGWNWDWPNQGYNVKAYPEVIFGRKPWSNETTHPSLPCRIINVESLIVDFDLTMNASGNYNLAFEFWVTADSMSDDSGITTEVMIWTDQNILLPAGTVVAVTTIDGVSYDLYYTAMDNWNYYAFLANSTFHQGTMNVHNFINYMIGMGYLNSSRYLASFEMGNEVIYGSGVTEVHHYSVAVQSLLGISQGPVPGKEFSLQIPFPNPFNAAVTIPFSLASRRQLLVEILDMEGRLVRQVYSGVLRSGQHQLNWNGESDHGSHTSSGVYIVKMSDDTGADYRKILYIR